ncbi:hypothetical protein DKZ23_10260 [Limosilactobacillus reuteri]|uniref:Uncharacterized protein n=1 Tax=Limosilactobacillus reuteri TaxID=1598 RepID=A0A317GGB6_LIMRT|nr:hypothetical protein DKZ23_10260 [Limosilactobacillus reuteri]PWT53206.1 hypothetical protein DKZ33_02560 [Limosilactobacillus reuteri]PWT63722.1 hypothetical protein DKZ32_02545 [Limosilactobacillus reuteri]
MAYNEILFVELDDDRVYHTFTYQGADVPGMQFFDIEGKPVSNPQGRRCKKSLLFQSKSGICHITCPTLIGSF